LTTLPARRILIYIRSQRPRESRGKKLQTVIIMIDSRPVIAITAGFGTEDPDLGDSMRKIVLNNTYIRSVALAGAAPLVLPQADDPGSSAALLGLADGLLVSGGGDLNPLCFGDEPRAGMGAFDDGRDAFELWAIKAAFERGLPIFGICRGLQAINVAFGGTLYQELQNVEGVYISHRQQSARRMPSHTVQFSGGEMKELFGGSVRVNSFHHQAAERIAPGFTVTGRAPDGVVESIERTDGLFVTGVQWHPECMAAAGDENMLRLFRRFAQVCAGKSHE
jgi:putative glutamine amidotransferase